MILDQLADDLKLVIRTNIEVGLHTLDHRLLEILRVNLKHNLEWESLQNGQLTSEVIRVLIDRQPNLHGVIRILSIDLVEIQSVIHALLNARNIVVVSNIEPVI